METVSIREVRGAALEALARQEQMVGLTNHRVLVAVLIPATTAWVSHLVETNITRLEQNLSEGEDELASGDLASLEGILGRDLSGESSDPAEGGSSLLSEARSVVGATASGAIDKIRSAFAGGTSTSSTASQSSSVLTVRIGDLSGTLIEEASKQGQSIALTNGRVLVGVLMPVSSRLVEHLVEENMSRVLMNIARGELELRSSQAIALDAPSEPPDASNANREGGRRSRTRRPTASA